MENILDVYELFVILFAQLPVWMKKHTSFLVKHVIYGQCVRETTKKIDSEYVRNGNCSIFAFIEPLGGRQHVSVRDYRPAVGWADEAKYLVSEPYPDIEKIFLIMDNLNTHKPEYLFKKYPPKKAHRINKKLEIRYTLKYGS